MTSVLVLCVMPLAVVVVEVPELQIRVTRLIIHDGSVVLLEEILEAGREEMQEDNNMYSILPLLAA